jgi:hypothetical protein
MNLHGLKSTFLLVFGIRIIILLVRICLLDNTDYDNTLQYNPVGSKIYAITYIFSCMIGWNLYELYVVIYIC